MDDVMGYCSEIVDHHSESHQNPILLVDQSL